jgi:poly(3-hydroxybutyrate) depolymerase
MTTRAVVAGLLLLAAGAAAGQDAGRAGFTAADRAAVRATVAGIETRLRSLAARGVAAELTADARVFAKAALWTVDFEPAIDERAADRIAWALRRAGERVADLEAGRHPWTDRHGSSVRGFVSGIDGSTQPYGLLVPRGHDASRPARLDVFLHGSRPATGIGEVLFLELHDRPDAAADLGPEVDVLELKPMGRLGENAYRFEGETDVFEAIEDVCRRYAIDRSRVVLRGGSLGGTGTWQIGLKHPDRFAALGPAAGGFDSRVVASAPLGHFVPIGPLQPWQEPMLRLMDAAGYAANAGMVPVVAVMGDQDPFLESHRAAERGLAREGVPFLGFVAEGRGHDLDRETRQRQLRILRERSADGIPQRPPRIRFVTCSLAYSRCHWVELLGLGAHYRRAEFEAALADDGSVNVTRTDNVARFALHPPALAGGSATLTVHGADVPLPLGASSGLVFERQGDAWRCAGASGAVARAGKQPGLQGPIDDAFASRFLCVRGTGTPTNAAVGDWADASLRRLAWEWRRFYHGDLPLKDDTAVTPADLRDANLILFGDPGSNRLIREVLSRLPVRWTADEIEVGGLRRPAADHGLVLVQPNPLPGAGRRYVVFNSGHTYHEPELRLSYLVFPRLGDWAVMRVGGVQPATPTMPGVAPEVAETVVTSGFFDDAWR